MIQSPHMIIVLTDPAIQEFIRAHQEVDVAALALKKPPDAHWPYAAVLAQIKARQKAYKKLPQWLETPGIIFPPPDTMEQASSAATARYKAGLAGAQSFIDLTGGGGADSWACAALAETAVVVEQDSNLAEILAHNFKIFYPDKGIQVIAGHAEDILSGLPRVEMILIDPQRRNQNQRGIFRLADGAPNILELLPLLKEKARFVILKTSPLLDIKKTLSDLPHVKEVHVVEWDGECKEVLYVLDFSAPAPEPRITAVRLKGDGAICSRMDFALAEEESCAESITPPKKFLYEPGPGFLKAGGFKLMAARYGLSKLAQHTHLYTGPQACTDFPGRGFEIVEVLPATKAAVLTSIPNGKANLSTRNFPMSTEDLKKKLGLKDGGEAYLFACSLQSGEKILIHAKKILKMRLQSRGLS